MTFVGAGRKEGGREEEVPQGSSHQGTFRNMNLGSHFITHIANKRKLHPSLPHSLYSAFIPQTC
jgi:hypothetical protein